MVGGADHAFLLHPLDQGGGAVVADLEAALDIAGRGLAVARDHGDGAVVEVVARAAVPALVIAPVAVAVWLVGDQVQIVGLGLRLQVFADVLDFLVVHERAVQAGDAAAARHIEHVALTQQLLAALFAQDGAAVDLGCDLEGDAGREVGLDGAGDDVHRGALGGHDQVDAGGAGHLGQTLNRAFDVLAGDQHQVGHLVHDHDQEGQGFGADLLGLVNRAALVVEAGLDRAFEMLPLGLGFAGALVVAGDVAHPQLGHAAIAILHLPHRPFQGDDGLLRIGDDRRQQVRNAVIDRQLQHLGVDHDEAAFGRAVAIQDRQDHGVDPHRLARAGGARDQQVRHPRQIGDIGFAADGLTQSQGQQMALLVVFRAGQKVAQIDGLAFGVGQFDADGVPALNHADAAGAGGHGAGDVVGQGHDAAVLDPRRGDQLVQGDDRPGADLVDHAAHAELLQHAFQHLGVLLQRILVDRGGALAGLAQYAQRRQVELTLRPGEVEGLLVQVVLPDLGRLDRGHARLDRTGGGRGGRRGRNGLGILPRGQVVVSGRGRFRRHEGRSHVQRRVGRGHARFGPGLLGRRLRGRGARGLARRGGGAQRSAPVQGVQKVRGADADGVGRQPQPPAQEHKTCDDPSAGNVQGADPLGRQPGQGFAPQAAQAGGQGPGGGRGQGRQGAGQQQGSPRRRQGLDRRGLQAGLKRVADRAGQAEGAHQQGGRPGGQTQRLHEQVGEQGAVRTQPVGRRHAGGGVQAGVQRIPRHQGDQQQNRQEGLKHAPEPHDEGRVPQDAGADPGLAADGEGGGHEGRNLPGG